MRSKGILVVISGFSGVGKGTVIELVMNALPNLKFSVSCTTRQPRKGEENGVDYHFLTEDEFEQKIKEDAFVEYTKTFTYHYGTYKSEIDKPIEDGLDVLMELNVVGAKNIKKLYPDCVTIFVTPPSIEALEARLIGRGSETPETLERRLKEIEIESLDIDKYDYIVTNNVAKSCAEEITRIIQSEHLKTDRIEVKNVFTSSED
ncbi:MAG: guanylate kinase [Clostridia bacterium]